MSAGCQSFQAASCSFNFAFVHGVVTAPDPQQEKRRPAGAYHRDGIECRAAFEQCVDDVLDVVLQFARGAHYGVIDVATVPCVNQAHGQRYMGRIFVADSSAGHGYSSSSVPSGVMQISAPAIGHSICTPPSPRATTRGCMVRIFSARAMASSVGATAPSLSQSSFNSRNLSSVIFAINLPFTSSPVPMHRARLRRSPSASRIP